MAGDLGKLKATRETPAFVRHGTGDLLFVAEGDATAAKWLPACTLASCTPRCMARRTGPRYRRTTLGSRSWGRSCVANGFTVEG
ncbi:MAG: hypothetical protein U0791_26975 [Gemmataceae bacterium]